jgi:very-short-patch-repair endonuclease
LENVIENYLLAKDIEYETQKKFSDCIDEKCLPFDIYIPVYKLLIEADGEQHFQSVGPWNGEEGFIKRVHHDIIKDDWCINNGKVLLRISYKDINNIEEIIKLAIEHIKIANDESADSVSGYILATLFYDTICSSKCLNGVAGVRDTSYYITII